MAKPALVNDSLIQNCLALKFTFGPSRNFSFNQHKDEEKYRLQSIPHYGPKFPYMHSKHIITCIKNNCLKLKNEVGMEVLKSKQTRVVYRDNQHIRIVHPYACFLIGSSECVILLYTSIHQYS